MTTSSTPPSAGAPDASLPASETLWRTIFEQNWLHARHAEVQRYTYALIYGGATLTLALGTTSLLKGWRHLWLAHAGIAVLTFVQMLISMKLGSEFANHVAKIEAMLSELPERYRQWVGLPQGGIQLTWGARTRRLPVRLRSLVPTLYFLMFLGWLSLAALEAAGVTKL